MNGRSKGTHVAKPEVGIEDISDRLPISKLGLGEAADSRTENRTSRAHMREKAEIIHRITLWAGSKRQAHAWYRGEPIPAFGDLTAENLVTNGKAAALGDYLDHLERGGFA